MSTTSKRKSRSQSYRVTTAQEFLDLSDDDMALIDLKVSLIKKLRAVRAQSKLTQKQLAKLIGSSQPRVAMLERGSPDVSLDLICRALLALGVSRNEIGKTISAKRAA